MKRMIVTVALFIAIAIATPMEAAPLLHDGLISVWSFDETPGTQTALDSGGINNNDAVFTPGMTTTGSGFTSGGVLGNYIQFNGYYIPGDPATNSDTAAIIAADSSMDIVNQMTFSTWIHMDEHPLFMSEPFVSIFDSLANDYVLFSKPNEPLVMLLRRNNSAYARVSAPDALTADLVDKWAHVAVVYDGRENYAATRMYVNGTEVASSLGLWGGLTTGQSPSFGATADENAGYYNGGIDETAIWNRALTPEEVSYLYNSGSGNAVMAANPEIGGTLPETPFTDTIVSSGTPIVKYDFEDDLDSFPSSIVNSGSLGVAGNAIYQNGTHSLDGINETSTISSETGKIGNALNLYNGNIAGDQDGDRFVIPVELSSIDCGTMSFWLKLKEDYCFNTFFSAKAHCDKWEMWAYGEERQDAIAKKYRLGLNGTIGVNPDPDATLNDGTPIGNENGFGGLDVWNHYTFRWIRNPEDSSKIMMYLYLNGVLVDSATNTWAESGEEFYFGGGLSDIGMNDFGSWVMDDFRLYDVALSSDAITAIFEEGQIPEPIAGDANRDGKVDGSDVTILAGNWQKGVGDGQNASWDDGDFNGDGKVDGSDVTILAGNWQAGVSAAAASVPEPSVFLMLFGAVIAGWILRKKR